MEEASVTRSEGTLVVDQLNLEQKWKTIEFMID